MGRQAAVLLLLSAGVWHLEMPRASYQAPTFQHEIACWMVKACGLWWCGVTGIKEATDSRLDGDFKAIAKTKGKHSF